MAKYIRTLTVYYDANISSKEIPYFRGAVLKSMGGKANILYHNHIDTGSFRYSYPLRPPAHKDPPFTYGDATGN